MKILIHHRIASRDGQAVHLEELSEALRGLGHEILMVGPAAITESAYGGSSRLVDLLKRLLPAAAYEMLEVLYNVRAYTRLRQAIRDFRPDFVYERFSLYLLAGVWARSRLGVPVVLEVNSPLFEERLEHDGLAVRWMARLCQKHIWTHVDRVLPVTEVLAGYVRRYGVPDRKIAVIPNGINPALFAAVPSQEQAKREGGYGDRLVLGFTGFVRRWHAMDRVIDFVAGPGKEFDLHLVIVGDGPAREELEAQALARGVSDRLTITGFVKHDEVAARMAAFDVALLPSINHFASPLKLFEYMYLGLPTVAPDMDNIREILTAGHDALLFDPAAKDGLTEAIHRLCSDAALRRAIGAQARRTLDDKSLYWRTNAGRVAGLGAAARAENG